MLVKALYQIASPAGRRARLSVLILHRVHATPDALMPWEMHAERFDELCSWLKSYCKVLPLDEAATRLRDGTLPARAACITFDDGYADNYHQAMPILRRHGISATFFIATGFLDGGCMWNDAVIESVRRTTLSVLALGELLGAGFEQVPMASHADRLAAINGIIGRIKYEAPPSRAALALRIAERAGVNLPTDLMMSSEELRLMHEAGMQIGAHTASHPILTRLDRPAATAEIAGSKRVLEDLLQQRVGLFAYPNGRPGVDYNAETIDIVREQGFDAAVTTHVAAADGSTDPFQIPRFTPWDRSRWRFGARLLNNLRADIVAPDAAGLNSAGVCPA